MLEVFNGMVDCEKFSIIRAVLGFCRGEFFGKESKRFPLAFDELPLSITTAASDASVVIDNGTSFFGCTSIVASDRPLAVFESPICFRCLLDAFLPFDIVN